MLPQSVWTMMLLEASVMMLQPVSTVPLQGVLAALLQSGSTMLLQRSAGHHVDKFVEIDYSVAILCTSDRLRVSENSLHHRLWWHQFIRSNPISNPPNQKRSIAPKTLLYSVIGKKVRRSRLFDTTWRNTVSGFFEPDGIASGSIGLYGTKGRSLWVCVCVCPSVMRGSVRTMKSM